jgi:glutathione S-transferase
MEAAHSPTPAPSPHETQTPAAQWLSLEEAVSTPGVRLVIARFGVPSPWSEFCRALFDVKRIDYRRVDGRDAEGSYHALRALSGQESVPVVLIGPEAPRASWIEQLLAAERLAPQVPLLPPDSSSRATVIGLIAELCGEGGFGWSRRLQMIARLTAPGAQPRDQQMGLYLRYKYGAMHAQDPEGRCRDIVATFADLLRHQLDWGKGFLFGDRLSALDLAWAAFAALIEPLPEADCPMSVRWRDLFRWTPEGMRPADLQMLLAHRDRIYRQHLRLPIPLS